MSQKVVNSSCSTRNSEKGEDTCRWYCFCQGQLYVIRSAKNLIIHILFSMLCRIVVVHKVNSVLELSLRMSKFKSFLHVTCTNRILIIASIEIL